jgi:O-antigen/teichoic acid export membrane protein
VTSITKRTTILIICRIANYGVMILSPVFLVRIFDMHSYGQYREFMLYAVLLSGLIEFTVNKNLIYFIPKYPATERESVTNTTFFMFVTSTFGLIVLYLCKGLIIARTSYNFIAPLMAYIFFFLNFEYFENYLLGKKRADYVLYYSSIRIVVRTAAIIAVAYATRSVIWVVRTLIILEVAKCILVAAILRRDFTRHIDRTLLKEQLTFIVPLGSAVTLSLVSSQLANLVISIKMGVERLALYHTSSQQIPIINIVQASATDVLFPEMAQIGDAERLHLWQRANVVFCFIAFPVYAVFFYFARVYVETLFTREYLAATPLFRIYLFIILLQCFDVGTPLRVINQNKYFIYGNIISLAVNVGLILLLFRSVGFVIPALAYVLGALVGNSYCGSKILKFYRIPLAGLFLWKKIAIVIACVVLALPVLVVSRLVGINPIVKAVSFSLLYLAVYYLIARRFKISEVELLSEKVASRLRGVLKRA